MSADDEVERVRRERQGIGVGDLCNLGPQRPQVPPGDLDVGRPGLGGGQHCRRARDLCQYLAAPGLDVQRGGGRGHPPGHQPGISLRRPFLAGSALEPGEVPALDPHGLALGEQFLERRRCGHAPTIPARRALGNAFTSATRRRRPIRPASGCSESAGEGRPRAVMRSSVPARSMVDGWTGRPVHSEVRRTGGVDRACRSVPSHRGESGRGAGVVAEAELPEPAGERQQHDGEPDRTSQCGQ